MRKTFNYGKHFIDDADKASVVDVMGSDFLTSGPKTIAFENALCAYTGAKYCVVVSSATAALHISLIAMGIGEGDEVITSPITFLSSSNCAIYVGAKPVFADIDTLTANIDPNEIERRITPNTKLLIPVHFAGQSCDMKAISAIAEKYGLKVLEDAAHAVGSDYDGKKVGCCQYSNAAVFSFHPVKNITSGEGGAVLTNDVELYKKLLALRSHGTHKDGEMRDNWKYEMRELGFNYRITDIQSSLGLSQLKKLDLFKSRRRQIVDIYNSELAWPHLKEMELSNACFHLYPVLLSDRDEFYKRAKAVGLNLQVHYIPVHTQPYYRSKFGYNFGDYPKAEHYYSQTISLPLFPALKDDDIDDILQRLKSIKK